MMRLIISLAMAFTAGAVQADEGDASAYSFQCNLVNQNGETRELTGAINDVEGRHPTGIAYLVRNITITDGKKQRSTEMNLSMWDRTFEAQFMEQPRPGAPKFGGIGFFQSYDFDWNRNTGSEGVVVLKRWHELRPMVRSELISTAAGMCTFDKRDAKA